MSVFAKVWDYFAPPLPTPPPVLPPPVPSYHDVHVTFRGQPRTSLPNLPYGYELLCTRTTGWRLWSGTRLVAEEYGSGKRGLIIDVGGFVICDSLTPEAGEE
jgi:hypothetical protein